MITAAVASLITGILGALVAGGTSIYQNIANKKSVEETNTLNQYNLERSWQRDDSQLQRARADAEKAGFSPNAALGNMPGNTNPMVMSAPEVDYSGVGESIRDASDSISRYKQLKLQETMQNATIKQVEEGLRGDKLDNDFKEFTFKVRAMKEALELDRLRKAGNLDEATYIKSLMELKANGLSDNFIQSMLDHRYVTDNTDNYFADQLSADDTIKSTLNKIKADTNLTNEQKKKIAYECSKLFHETTGVKLENAYKTLRNNTVKAKKSDGTEIDLSTALDILKKDGERSTLSMDVPALTIGGHTINAMHLRNGAELKDYLTMLGFISGLESSKRQANLDAVINDTPLLAALFAVFGGAFGNDAGKDIVDLVNGLQ